MLKPKKVLYVVVERNTNQEHTILVTPKTNRSKAMFEYIFFNNQVGRQVGNFTFSESRYATITDLNIDTSSFTHSTKGKFIVESFPEYFI